MKKIFYLFCLIPLLMFAEKGSRSAKVFPADYLVVPNVSCGPCQQDRSCNQSEDSSSCCCGPSNSQDLAVNRAQLSIYNWTNTAWEGDPSGRGEPRYLHLVWSKDVHQPPQEDLCVFGENAPPAKRKSKGIGNGDNIRNFRVEVYREFFGNLKRVGEFTHGVYSGVFTEGADNTYIHKAYVPAEAPTRVELWRTYYKTIGESGEWAYEKIGSLTIAEWEGVGLHPSCYPPVVKPAK